MKLASTYYHFRNSKARVQVHQGGTRSGKTMSILTGLVELCYRNPNAGIKIGIFRKTFPALRASCMADFFEILHREGIYNEAHHNRRLNEYALYGNLVQFSSIDMSQKVRGAKRDVLFVNEANEITLEDFRQLILRTTNRVILDYNPSDEFHWIYDEVIPRDDAEFFQTTYLDNPFLEPELIEEIERLKDVDENYWRVFGLGERGVSQATIFTHWKEVDALPSGYRLMNVGIDFGYTNDPTAIIKVYTDGHGFAVEEIAYATKLTNYDIAGVLKDNDIHRELCVADSAEPKSIDEIFGYGVNIQPARKGPDSVRAGIQFMQSRPLLVLSSSLNLIKELRNYKWMEDKNGRTINKPLDTFNHAIDASRYAIMFNQTNPNFGKYAIG